jgi:hypothetical protein
MQLIGMLDSPYVRRVAISLQLLGLAFEHRSLSVFRTFDEFRKLNPVVKAPTLARDAIDQSGVTTAVAWRFTQMLLPEVVDAADYPALREFSSRAEQLAEFMAAPHGPDNYRGAA